MRLVLGVQQMSQRGATGPAKRATLPEDDEAIAFSLPIFCSGRLEQRMEAARW